MHEIDEGFSLHSISQKTLRGLLALNLSGVAWVTPSFPKAVNGFDFIREQQLNCFTTFMTIMKSCFSLKYYSLGIFSDYNFK